VELWGGGGGMYNVDCGRSLRMGIQKQNVWKLFISGFQLQNVD
jgi:hypothetical protein